MSHKPIFLYVEDDPVSRRVLQMQLSDLGYTKLIMFEDSDDFLAKVDDLPEKPTVIFLDIHVKPYDGFSMLSMLREQPDYQDCIIIALTASVMSEEVAMLKNAHFNGVIAKPLKPEEFPDILHRILNGEEVWWVA